MRGEPPLDAATQTPSQAVLVGVGLGCRSQTKRGLGEWWGFMVSLKKKWKLKNVKRADI